MSHICDVSPLCGSECVPSIRKPSKSLSCNWCQAQAHENGKKKLLVFRPPFGLNNDYGGNFKGGVPPLMVVRRGHSPLTAHANGGFRDPAQALHLI